MFPQRLDAPQAYGIAKACHREGAELAFSYQGERFKDRITDFAAECGSSLVFDCDVSDDAQIAALFDFLKGAWPEGFDGFVHSIGFAPREAIAGDFLEGLSREAFRIAREEMAEEGERIRKLHQRLVAGLTDIERVFINGNMQHRVPHNLNISFNYVEGESLIMGIKGLAVSSGSACTSASLEPSYVLRALGRSDELAHSSLRMTIGRYTTEAEIDYAIETIKLNVAKLRDLSPLWEMFKDGIDISTIQWAAH
eukprot:gene40385-53387_t